MFSIARRLYSLMILSGFLISPTSIFARQIGDDIRIDLPAGGQVRVQNQFGSVTAEVWGNEFVSVSARVEGGVRLSRSPILIENRGKLLSISVVRAPIDPVIAVDITVKVPESSNLEVVTTRGGISTRGLCTSMVLKSSSGDIQADLPASVSASITARAPRGTIKSNLEPASTGDGHVLQTRLGSSSKSLDIQSDSGQVFLTVDSNMQTVKPDSVQPELLGSKNPSRAVGTPANQPATDELSEGDVIRVDSQLVTLNMSVIDRSTNRGLTGLAQSDFQLFEDGLEQRIVEFESSSSPFDLVLLIDLSGSTKDVVKLIRAAALRFINAARPADRIAIITFAGEATIVSGLTANREQLRQSVSAIDTARGDTKLYDAIQFTINEVNKESKKSRRSAIVLMSDGLDGTVPGVSDQVGSQRPYQEVLRNVQEFDGVLYTLWLDTTYEALNPRDTQPEAFDLGHDRLRELAETGGGIFYEVNRLEDLAGAYEQVVADLGTVYSLAYRPANKTRDGKWRAIRIGVSRANAVARGKRGYYAN